MRVPTGRLHPQLPPDMSQHPSSTDTKAVYNNLFSKSKASWSSKAALSRGVAAPVGLLSKRASSSLCKGGTIAHTRPFIEGAKLTEPLNDSDVPVVYLHTLCPFAQRVWIAFLEKVPSINLISVSLLNA